MRVVRQNLTFAMTVIVALIFSAFLNLVTLPLGVVGHEGSTVIVVLNGLRLLGFGPGKSAAAALLQAATAAGD